MCLLQCLKNAAFSLKDFTAEYALKYALKWKRKCDLYIQYFDFPKENLKKIEIAPTVPRREKK